MRRILAFSIAAIIPAMLPAGPAGARTRPAPPLAGAHDRSAIAQRVGAHLRPVPPLAPLAYGVSAPAAASGDRPAVVPGAAPASGPSAARPGTPVSPQPGTSVSPAPSSGAGPGGDQAGNQAPTQLVLKRAVVSETPRTVTLRCDPVGGTHPKAAQACADLARSHGDLTVDPKSKRPQACFMIYAPVTVSAEGRWHGEAYQNLARYPNTCVLKGKTGSIFDF